MSPRRWHTRFESDALVLVDYPFPRGGRPSRIPARALSEVCVGWSPPTVRTHEGEYLFVPATHARELADFASQYTVPFLRRVDVWSLVLEEFLDTGFTPEQQEATLRRLEETGVSRAETRAMRERVADRMLAFTAITWEWVHYGLYDVLSVMKSSTFFLDRSFPRFYEEAMRLAERGDTRPSSREELLRGFPSPG